MRPFSGKVRAARLCATRVPESQRQLQAGSLHPDQRLSVNPISPPLQCLFPVRLPHEEDQPVNQLIKDAKP